MVRAEHGANDSIPTFSATQEGRVTSPGAACANASGSHGRQAPRLIRVLAYPGVDLLDLAGPLEVFEVASLVSAPAADPDCPREMLSAARQAPAYEVELTATTRSRLVRTHSGVTIQAHARMADRDLREPVNTFLLPGGDIDGLLKDRRSLDFVSRSHAAAGRTVSVCNGALALAAAGVLDNRRATTHWLSCQELPLLGRGIVAEPDAIFVRDGNVWTSAGSTAGIDLALALVEEDLGWETAMRVARMLVLPLRRQGGQSQFSPTLKAQSVKMDGLREALSWASANLTVDLRVERLAERARMSPRNFARTFVRELGQTPARFVERLRIDAARRLLEQTDDGLEAVAQQCGIASADALRRSFLRLLGVPPGAYGERFRRRPRRLPVEGNG